MQITDQELITTPASDEKNQPGSKNQTDSKNQPGSKSQTNSKNESGSRNKPGVTGQSSWMNQTGQSKQAQIGEVKTGDANNIAFPVATGILALCVLILILVVRKKYKTND